MKKNILTAFFLSCFSAAFGQTTDKNISVSGFPDTEPFIAVNPANANNLIAAWMHWNGKEVIYTKASFDGGVTWGNQNALPHVSANFTSADVSIAFNKAGDAFLSYVDYKLTIDSGYVRTTRSTNGGVSWSSPVNAVAMNASADKPVDRPWITVDNTAGTYSGRLYLVSKSYYAVAPPQKVWLSVSSDSGKTWSSIKQLDDSIPTGLTNIMGTPTVGADGALYVAYMSYKPSMNPYARVIVTKSIDGGINFIPHDAMHFAANSASTDTLYQGSYSLSANPTTAGNIIFQGTDSRNGDMDILSVYSNDGGMTWSSPTRANDDAIGNGIGQDMSWGSFSPNGAYVVAWRDRRNGSAPTSDTSAFEIYVAVSGNGGSSFYYPNYKMSSALSPFPNIQRGNDFIGVCFNNNSVFSDWCDKRTGNTEIFFRGEFLSHIIPLAVENLTVSNFKFEIFPNPSAKGNINYKIDASTALSMTNAEIKIFDNAGKEVFSRKINSESGTLNANLPSGTYLVKFKNDGRVEGVKKIVVLE